MAPDQRARHQPPAQLGEDQHRLGHAEREAAARLGQAQLEHAHLGQVAPERAVEPARRQLAQLVERDPSLAEGADPGAQRFLILVDPEIHQRSLGRPRMRSATMLRWICELPAAIVSDKDWSALCSTSRLGRPPTSSRESAARPSRRIPSSAIRW